MSEALKCASQLVDMLSKYKAPSTQRGQLNGAIEELRRLAGVEAELQQAREERTALLVNEQNLREELAALRRLIANDAHACTFQSLGQYRTALLKDTK